MNVKSCFSDARYDAFILYADEDSDFAHDMIDKMEKEYGLKVIKLIHSKVEMANLT